MPVQEYLAVLESEHQHDEFLGRMMYLREGIRESVSVVERRY